MAVIRVLHTADNHVDPKLTFLGPKSLERRRDFMDAFRRVVEYAVERKPHLFLVSGDLFDSVNPRNPPRTQVIRAFRRLHSEGVRVFLIAGNHDMPRSVEEGMSPLHEVEASGYAKFFSLVSKPEVEHVTIDGVDVAVVGLSFNPEVPPDENPLRFLGAKLPVEGDINIAMLHYNLAGVKAPAAWRAPMIAREDVPDGYIYVALGHVHSRTVIDLGSVIFAYPGSTERRSFNEEEDPVKGFLWAELPLGGKPKVEFIEVPTRPMRTVRVELSPAVEDPIGHVLQRVPAADPQLLLRLSVRGKLPLAKLGRYSRATLLKHLERFFFYVVIDDSELRCEVQPAGSPSIEAKSPIEAFRDELEERLKSSQSLEEREALMLALKIGVQKLEEAGGW
ncbi:MAG: DNA repair exonuclease [Thermofilaceae archaeon]